MQKVYIVTGNYKTVDNFLTFPAYFEFNSNEMQGFQNSY